MTLTLDRLAEQAAKQRSRAHRKTLRAEDHAKRSRPAGMTSTTTPAGIAANNHNGSISPPFTPDDPPAEAPPALLPYDPVNLPVTLRAQDIDVNLIFPSPYQTRRDFDPDELAALAESLRTDGLLQPIVVRPRAHDRNGTFQGWELIAGERRLRAARLAGWTKIPAQTADVTDAKAAALVLVENLQRSDLNPWEEAEGYQRFLTETNATQAELARHVGRSQPHIANALRLLDLPEPWKARLISREMSPSHARELLPWLAYPTIAKEIASDWKEHDEPPTLAEFKEQIRHCAYQETAPIDGTDYHYALNKSIKWDIDPSHHAALKLVSVPRYRSNESEQRALNVKLAQKLKAEAIAAAVKLAATRQGSAKAATKPKAERTPAEERAAAKERDRKLAEALTRWSLGWDAYLIAQKIALPGFTTEAQALLLFCTVETRANYADAARLARRSDALAAALNDRGPAKPRDFDAWKALRAALDTTLEDETADFLRRLFWNPEEDQPAGLLPDAIIRDLATDLSIDRAAAWKQEKAGPLTRPLFELHTVAQLETLADFQNIDREGVTGKAALVDLLTDAPNPTRLPAALAPQPAAKSAKKRKPR